MKTIFKPEMIMDEYSQKYDKKIDSFHDVAFKSTQYEKYVKRKIKGKHLIDICDE